MLELILIIIGLAICFGGIYLRKPMAGLIGLTYGAGIGFILALIMADDEIMALGIVAIFALGLAATAFKFDRFCAALSSFGSSFAVAFLLMAIVADSFEALLIVSLLAALAGAGISFKFYDYSFIVSTAFTGGFIASLGGVPLFNDASLERLVSAFFWGSTQAFNQILIVTIILGIVGGIVQYQRLKNMSATKNS